ncbi:hypothetical protein TCAL_00233 [Tigriopus californicus]|uniref:6-pyruvoyl tetrahydrobiopterin synthase n=1 Tax=Tigriopus californicus TaxID=6832 RepID=A0A553P3D5_TIGCA|nr:6-pyruvoyl tetrahydrobiopterin synthase-like [Tigriopus californicus]TRY72184.1 hypothetical protein TCAL_00233 [Tigriopus californicus]
MAMVYLTRRETFCASHRLHNPELSDEENRDIFGKCNHIHGHGHNYVVEVTVSGSIDPRTGMVMNLVDLKHLIHESIMAPMDHKNLDLDVEEFRDEGRISTTENLSIVIWERIQRLMGSVLSSSSVRLFEVKIWETEKNIVVYRG